MNALLTVALAIFHLQAPTVDAPGIVAAALERLVPTRPPSASAQSGKASMAQRTLFLDVTRTTESFRSIDALVSPDFSKIGRPFVTRSCAEAIRCSAGVVCRVADDGVYAAVTLVERQNAADSYRIKLLLCYNGGGGGPLQGTESEMFVRLDKHDGWKVDRIGIISVLD